MKTAAELLRSIELRAERAIVQELQLMIQEILGIRHALILDDRSHADALLLRLDQLASSLRAEPSHRHADAGANPQQHTPSSVHPVDFEFPHEVRLYHPEYGDLEDVLAAKSFGHAVRLVRQRVQVSSDQSLELTLSCGRGSLTLETCFGTVIASVCCSVATPEDTNPAGSPGQDDVLATFGEPCHEA